MNVGSHARAVNGRQSRIRSVRGPGSSQTWRRPGANRGVDLTLFSR